MEEPHLDLKIGIAAPVVSLTVVGSFVCHSENHFKLYKPLI